MKEHPIDMPALTGRIDQLLADKRCTPARMCRDLGFSSGLYSQWKKGLGSPSAAKLLAVARYLEVSIDYLLGYDPAANEAPLRRTILTEIRELDEKSLEKVLDYVRFTADRQKKEEAGLTPALPPKVD